MTWPSLLSLAGGLAVVLGLLLVGARLLRRLPSLRRENEIRLRVLGRTALSPDQGVAVVQVGRRRMAVGYGDGGVRLLLALEDGADEPSSARVGGATAGSGGSTDAGAAGVGTFAEAVAAADRVHAEPAVGGEAARAPDPLDEGAHAAAFDEGACPAESDEGARTWVSGDGGGLVRRAARALRGGILSAGVCGLLVASAVPAAALPTGGPSPAGASPGAALGPAELAGSATAATGRVTAATRRASPATASMLATAGAASPAVVQAASGQASGLPGAAVGGAPGQSAVGQDAPDRDAADGDAGPPGTRPLPDASGTGAGGMPELSFQLGSGDEPLRLSGPVGAVLLIGALTLLPTLILLTTSFTRILVVLHLLKQAIGTQTAPPAHLLAALALLLTAFVMAPTLQQVNETGLRPWMEGEIDEAALFERVREPVRDFMLRTTRESHLTRFVEMSPTPDPETVDEVPTVALASAFVTSELKTAFQMGFVLFLPFVIIDIVVASVLMSMGMFMLPPVMVSLPFKLLLFVLVDGWTLVVGGLVRSF